MLLSVVLLVFPQALDSALRPSGAVLEITGVFMWLSSVTVTPTAPTVVTSSTATVSLFLFLIPQVEPCIYKN